MGYWVEVLGQPLASPMGWVITSGVLALGAWGGSLSGVSGGLLELSIRGRAGVSGLL